MRFDLHAAEETTMMSIYMILTALGTTALAQGATECHFTEVTGDQQCYGAVGQLLVFYLPNIKNTNLRLRKGKTLILTVNKNKVNLNEDFGNQAELSANGTFKLGKVMKNHSGEYEMEEHGLDGRFKQKVKMHLQIQDPVSKPAVSQVCLPPEQIINCSSQGDDAQFSLTLDGVLLKQTTDHNNTQRRRTTNRQYQGETKTEEDKPRISKVSVNIHSSQTGRLTCAVWNNVSREETDIQVTMCKDTALGLEELSENNGIIRHSPAAINVKAVVITVLLLAMSVCVCIVHRKYTPAKIEDDPSKDEISIGLQL